MATYETVFRHTDKDGDSMAVELWKDGDFMFLAHEEDVVVGPPEARTLARVLDPDTYLEHDVWGAILRECQDQRRALAAQQQYDCDAYGAFLDSLGLVSEGEAGPPRADQAIPVLRRHVDELRLEIARLRAAAAEVGPDEGSGPRCGDECDGMVCYRMRGHDGEHEGHNADGSGIAEQWREMPTEAAPCRESATAAESEDEHEPLLCDTCFRDVGSCYIAHAGGIYCLKRECLPADYTDGDKPTKAAAKGGTPEPVGWVCKGCGDVTDSVPCSACGYEHDEVRDGHQSPVYAEPPAAPLPDDDLALLDDITALNNDLGRRLGGERDPLEGWPVHDHPVGRFKAWLERLARHVGDDASAVALSHLRDVVASLAPAAAAPLEPARPHRLVWSGVEWVDDRCGCRYHPDDDNGSHGGAPHVHRCERHGGKAPEVKDGTPEPGERFRWTATHKPVSCDECGEMFEVGDAVRVDRETLVHDVDCDRPKLAAAPEPPAAPLPLTDEQLREWGEQADPDGEAQAAFEAAAPLPEPADLDGLGKWRAWAWLHVGPMRRCSDLRDALDRRLAAPSAPQADIKRGRAEGYEIACGRVWRQDPELAAALRSVSVEAPSAAMPGARAPQGGPDLIDAALNFARVWDAYGEARATKEEYEDAKATLMRAASPPQGERPEPACSRPGCQRVAVWSQGGKPWCPEDVPDADNTAMRLPSHSEYKGPAYVPKVGDRVVAWREFDDDEGDAGWLPHMGQHVGTQGAVVEVAADGDVLVDFDLGGRCWWYGPALRPTSDEPPPFRPKEGQRVRVVTPDEDCPNPAKHGDVGIVTDVLTFSNTGNYTVCVEGSGYATAVELVEPGEVDGHG